MSSTKTGETIKVRGLDIGKVLSNDSYFHISLLENVPDAVRLFIEEGIALTSLALGRDFNVVRISHDMSGMSLLDYPRFFDDPFPALHRSWYVDSKQKTFKYRNYQSSANPPYCTERNS